MEGEREEEFSVSVVVPSKEREELEMEASDVVEKKTYAGRERVKEPKWPTSWLWQFCVLSVRTFRQSRHIILSKTSLIQTIAISIISALIWFQISLTEEGISNIFGLVINMSHFSPLLTSLLLPSPLSHLLSPPHPFISPPPYSSPLLLFLSDLTCRLSLFHSCSSL